MVKKINHTLLYIAVILLSIMCLLPFVLMLVNATRDGNDILKGFTLLPGTSSGKNWQIVQDNLNILRGLINSLLIAVAATVLTAYFSALTAYALAFYKFKGRNVIMVVILVSMMIPAQLGLLGFYDLVNGMGLVNTYVPLIVPAIASPPTVFFLRQYVLSVMPKSLLEAPRIDGASEIKIFHKVALPIMMPGIATMSIGGFIGSWNSYLTPLVILHREELKTLPVLIASLDSKKNIATNLGAKYMAVAISVIPILIVFAFCSKYIISSISAGSVKE